MASRLTRNLGDGSKHFTTQVRIASAVAGSRNRLMPITENQGVNNVYQMATGGATASAQNINELYQAYCDNKKVRQ